VSTARDRNSGDEDTARNIKSLMMFTEVSRKLLIFSITYRLRSTYCYYY